MKRALRYIFGTLAALGLVSLIAGFGFIYSGAYNIAASEPHLWVERFVLTTTQRNSVREHAEGTRVPDLTAPELVRRGFELYQVECLVCHGAPGVARARLGRGLSPQPPLLITEVAEWSDAEIFWIIENGLKMAGMPSFGTGLSRTDIWALTAFVRRLPQLSLDEYDAMVAWSEGRLPEAAVDWVGGDEPGFVALIRDGDPDEGKRLLGRYGCGTCHRIPGLRSARGQAGPPLDAWAERHFIAGTLLNTPANLVRFLADPQAVEPGTVMPDLGVSDGEALDMAAYLFRLGEPPFALHTVLTTQPSGEAER